MAKTLNGPYADLEMGSTSLYPSQPSDEIQLRWAFIRKIYSILTIQLLLTIAVASVVVFVRPVAHFFVSTPAGLALYILAIFIPLILIWPLYYYSQKHPVNYILLAAFTVFMGFSVGLTCAFTAGKIILESAILTAVVVVSLTLYTFWAARRGHDFSFLAPILFAGFMVLLVFILIQIIVPLGRLSVMIYGALGVHYIQAAMGPKNSANAYEEVRKQRLEENKKRILHAGNHLACDFPRVTHASESEFASIAQ